MDRTWQWIARKTGFSPWISRCFRTGPAISASRPSGKCLRSRPSWAKHTNRHVFLNISREARNETTRTSIFNQRLLPRSRRTTLHCKRLQCGTLRRRKHNTIVHFCKHSGARNEMSVILRQDTLPLAEKCSQCQCANPGTAVGSWMEWKVCFYFA